MFQRREKRYLQMMGRLPWFVVSLPLVIGCGSKAGGDNEGTVDAASCTSDADCESGMICSNGMCVSSTGVDAPPLDRDAACAAVMAEGTLVKKPVDIIFVIDNSGSMTAEIIGVEKNVNDSFAQIIGASGIDYRVILLSTHGSASGNQSICIASPLSGHPANTSTKLCQTPLMATPVNTSRFFHYSTEIGSTNSFRKILDTYNVADPSGAAPGGWSDWLRADATKTFIEITDDNQASSTTAATFETQLFAKTPKMFGDATTRNYIFHSIIGVVAKTMPADAYQPAEPVVTALCPSAVNNGGQYQTLSKTTGGLRFPVCDPNLYATVFQQVAQGVISGAEVACEFPVPTPPNGQTVDPATAVVDYTPGNGGAIQTFTQVADATQCAPSKFYIDTGKIVLCPDTCNVVKNDVMAKVAVYFGCTTPIF
jgi:hypothetical protein